MARFTGKNDPGFTSVSGELRRWVNEIKSPDRENRIAARTDVVPAASSPGVNINANTRKSLSLGGITILGDVVKSNVVSNNQTIHGGLTFKDS
jgi:hypothetical protein